jgi:hypothetical protein
MTAEIPTGPRTIDNLGVEASTRYALDQKEKEYAESIIKESRLPSQAEIDVTTPSFASAFEDLFEMQKRNIPWGDTPAPPKYNEQKKRLFTHQILPSLGSEDKIEAQSERITATVRTTETKVSTGDETRMSWENEREVQEQEKEKKTLLGLFSCKKALDKDLIEINSRRGQYQRG